jgi:hypothetical protein
MSRTPGVNLSLGHVLRIAFGLGAAGTAVSASAATPAAIPSQIFGTGAWMAGRISRLHVNRVDRVERNFFQEVIECLLSVASKVPVLQLRLTDEYSQEKRIRDDATV